MNGASHRIIYFFDFPGIPNADNHVTNPPRIREPIKWVCLSQQNVSPYTLHMIRTLLPLIPFKLFVGFCGSSVGGLGVLFLE